MSEDVSKEISELKRRLAELEAKQSAKEPPRPRMNMQPIDWTEGMRMPPDAAQKMAAVVPDVKDKGFNPHAWSQTKMGEPGGFGPAEGNWPKGPTKVRPEEELKVPKPPRSYWSK